MVNIFGRLEVESLLLDVPLVCKPWHKATLTPLCWQRLAFPSDIFKSRILADAYQVGAQGPRRGLIKLVVNRSQRSATLLQLPDKCTRDELVYVSDECPALKHLVLPGNVLFDHENIIPGLISKWKSLEMLRLGSCSYNNLLEILDQINLHCKNFVSLSVTGAYIGNETASKIVTLLPNIKYLILNKTTLYKQSVVIILQGCKQLVQLDVRNCTGFEEGDDEIVTLASQIKNFCCEGSRSYYANWNLVCASLQ